MSAAGLGPRLASFRASFKIAAPALAAFVFGWFTWSASDFFDSGADRAAILLRATVETAGLAGIAAAAIGIAIRLFPVRVHRGGVVGFGIHGFPAAIAWGEISRVARISWFGADYLELTTTPSGRRVLVPCDLVEPRAFLRAVAAVAGKDHPLARLLE